MLFRSVCFCRNYVLAVLTTYVAMFIMTKLGGLAPNFAVLVILPPIAAAMAEGQVFVRRHGCRPDTQKCWKASLRMCALVVLLWLAVVIPMLILYPGQLAALAEVDATGRAAVYLLLCFLSCCILRAGYAIGLATELKGQQFSDR